VVERALGNPHAVAVGALAVLVLGVTCLARIPVDLLAIFPVPAVQVVTFYPGMPPEVMERDIMSRLERWTGQSNGIARQEGKAMLGVSIVKNFFRDDIDPDSAMSQVTSYAMSDLFYLPPGTIPPMVMPFDPTASIPLCLLSVSSAQHDETRLYDIAYFDLRNRLQGITGVIAPAVYGGKLRRILAYVDPDRLQARNLAPMDVVAALRASNVFIPTGDARLGDQHYLISTNGMVPQVSQLDDIPVKIENGAPVFLKDVGQVRDAHQIQTNIVRINGRRQVYIPIYRQPGANTIRIVEGVREATAGILSRLPKGISLDVIMDQSVYVRNAIAALVSEAALGVLLAALVVLLFLGSLRSTLISSLAIPLSALAAFIGLYATGESVNAMTLGGLALVIGRLVDDTIVVLENTVRHRKMGKTPREAARDAAREVAMPVLVATLTTVVVFAPIVFLSGLGKYLFRPLALAVAFSMLASYVVAMTVVPAGCARFLRGGTAEERAASFFERAFDRIRTAYAAALEKALDRRGRLLGAVLALFLAALAAIPWIGTELFPAVDAGQFMLRVRAPSGTRLEKTEELCVAVERTIREVVPAADLQMLITNIGVLNDWPAAYTPNSGPMDAFLLVQLAEHRRASALETVRLVRRELARRFPAVEFSFDTGGLITAALNFGLPSPIDIQVEGNRLDVAHDIGETIRALVAGVPGTVDVRIQQKIDYPTMEIDIDRARAAYVGLTPKDVVTNVVTALNSSINFDPAFWIDERNGNHYFIGAQYAEDDIRSMETLEDIPIRGDRQDRPVPLRNVASIRRGTGPAEINHHNITRVTDVFANVDGRDLGSVAAEIEARIAREIRPHLPEGYFVRMRGEVASMKESFGGLGFGFLLAVVLIFLVMVAQFRSFLDPFIVMFAVPLGIVGVVGALLLTGTTINIQSVLGVVFMAGIAVSNSILLVEFANRLGRDGAPLRRAVVEAGATRLRPILMTSAAAVIALLPMAIGIGRGAEVNVPLARAVVGGLVVSTVLTLFVVPALYLILKARRERPA